MNLVIGNKYKCKAVEIREYGAIMEMEDGSTQLLHISNISDKFVRNVSDYITVGESYEVTAIQGRVRDIEITMRDPSNNMYQRPPKRESNFEDMLKDYLPTDKDRRYKNDRDYNRRGGKRNKGRR